jgi:hypothetical protein
MKRFLLATLCHTVKHLRELELPFISPSLEPSTLTVDADGSVCCRLSLLGISELEVQKSSFIPNCASAVLPAQLTKLFRTVPAVALVLSLLCQLHALDSCYLALCVEVLVLLRRTSCVTNCNTKNFNIP